MWGHCHWQEQRSFNRVIVGKEEGRGPREDVASPMVAGRGGLGLSCSSSPRVSCGQPSTEMRAGRR